MSADRDLAAVLLRHRGTCAGLVVAATLVALAGVARLDFDDDYRTAFRSDSSEYRLLDQLTTDFGREENDLFVLLESENVLRPNGLRRLYGLHTDLAATEGITSVYSLVSLPRLALPLRRRAPDEDLRRAIGDEAALEPLRGRILSADGQVTLLAARLGDEALTLAELEPILERAHRVADSHGARVTGLPEIRSAVIRAIQRDQMIFNLTAVGLAAGVGLLVFRRLAALVLVGIGPALGVVWTLGLLGWTGESINVLNNLVPQLVLAIGFTDAVHLLLHFRRGRTEGLANGPAALATVREVGVACFLTSLTTAVGFASLWFARIELISRFGLACAAGALLTFVAVVVTVPLLCSTPFGDRVLPSDAYRRRRQLDSRIARLTRPAFAAPLPCAVAAAALLIGLAALSSTLRPDHRYTENLPDQHDVADVIALRERAFGGSVPILVRLDWETDLTPGAPAVLAAVREVEEAMGAEPLISGVTSFRQLVVAAGGDATAPMPTLARLPSHLLHRWVAPDSRAVLVAGFVPDVGSGELLPRLEALRDRLAGTGNGGIAVRVGGLTALAASASVQMIGDLARSLGFAAIVIFGAMAVAFRSLPIALVSLVPNLLPLVCVTATLVVLDLPLQYTSVAVLGIGLGLAVDDTIHFLTVFRRHGGRAATARAGRRAIHGVGAALLTTTALLTAGLATLMLSALPTVRLFGALMCVLLLSALVADLYALPALLLVVGNRSRRRATGESEG